MRVRGHSDHAGTTPIEMRRDALLAAAEMIVEVRRLALDLGEPARATVGTLTVRPNQPNIVAGEVELIVDSRHPDRDLQRRLVDLVQRRCDEVAAEHRVDVETSLLVDQPPTPLDPTMIALAERVIQRRGWRFRRMVSGAGHDSQILGRQIPTVMIFVPSLEGRSHSPAEFTPLEQIVPGVQALADAVEELAMGSA